MIYRVYMKQRKEAMKGSRSGATILLITVIPGGFLLHLSSGIVISLAHGYIWDKSNENKAILATIKSYLDNLQNGLRALPLLPQGALNSACETPG